MGAGDDFSRSRLVGLHQANMSYLVSSSDMIFNPNELSIEEVCIKYDFEFSDKIF